MNQGENPITSVRNRKVVPLAPEAGWVAERREESGTMQSPATDTLLDMIWRRRWIVIGCVVIAIGAAFGYLKVVVPLYSSTSRIVVEKQGPQIMEDTAQGIMTQSNNYLFTQAELLQSTDVLAAAVESLKSHDLILFQAEGSPVGIVKGSLEVSVGEKDDIIDVSLAAPNAIEASLVVNAVVDSYIAYHESRKRSTSAEVLHILKNEREKRVAELSQKLQAVMDFKKEHPLLALQTERSYATLEAATQLMTAETDAKLATIEAKSQYEALRKAAGKPETLAQYMTMNGDHSQAQPAVLELRELIDRMGRLEEMRFEDRLLGRNKEHPSALTLQAEMDEMQKRIDEVHKDLADAQMTLANQRYLAAQNIQKQIHDEAEVYRREAVEFNNQQANYAILQSEWEHSKRLCDLLYDRIRELGVSDEAGALNISVLERAKPSGQPATPQPKRTFALALAMGVISGCGLALVRDLTDPRLRSSGQATAMLSAPTLGAVPSIPKRSRIGRAGQKLLQEEDSPATEAYRALRTTILHCLPHANAKSLVVTSPQTHEGKTTFVSNLAVSLACAGQSVIVLDADFRKPTQHRILQVQNEDGLSDVIAGKLTVEEAIQHSSIGGLDILSTGSSRSRPAEAFSSQNFFDVMEALSRSSYDLILIDAPPVLPVADTHVLASICDATLLILRAHKTINQNIQQARNLLAGVGANIIGAVINDVRRGKTQYGSYYYGYDATANRKVTPVQVRHTDTRWPNTPVRALRVSEVRQRASVANNANTF